jgi:filamentous hemagglutinin family protein
MATYREQNWRLTGFFKAIGAITLAGGCATFSGNPVLAQVTPDATLGGESSRVTSPQPGGFQIDEGATRGTNLFHSFQEFSVPTNGFAYFNNAPSIQNIISRVTGASVSNIDGVIKANDTANVFLINPNGIVFGTGASLNIGGSFLASTANSVVFDNGFEFSATNPQGPPLLTVNVPLGLQFGANPGSIANQSRANGVGLQVQLGRTLGLVGGEVALEGGILAVGEGRIELGSVAGNSRVRLTPNSTGYTLGYEGVDNFQDIRLTQRAAVVLANANVGGGSIQVQGRNVTLTDGSRIEVLTLGSGVGGSLTVNASGLVQLIGTASDGQSPSGIAAVTLGAGKAGDVRLTAGQLLMRDGAVVSASTVAEGEGGSVIVEVSDSVQLIGTTPNGLFGSGIGSVTLGAGKAGDVRLTAGQLLVTDGAGVSANTFAQGEGGSVIVEVSDSVQLIGTTPDGQSPSGIVAQTLGAGKAGDVRLTAGQLLVRDGAVVSASTFGEREGGSVIVEVSDSVQLIGTSADGQFPSGIGAETQGAGKAGDVRVTAGQLLVRDGATVSASTFAEGEGGSVIVEVSDSVQLIGTTPNGLFGSGITAQTLGAGKAGDVRLTAGQLLARDGAGVSASTFAQGEGGSVIVEVSDSVQLIGTIPNGQSPSGIVAETQGAGKAGDVRLTAGQLLVRDGAVVSASTFGEGEGGDLTVNASESVQVIGTSADGQFPSRLSVRAAAGSTAGNLTVQTRQMSVQDEAEVTVSSPQGQAGNLTITADSLTLNRGTISAETAKSEIQGGANITLQGLDLLRMDNESLISANALEDANGGNVTIDSTFIVATPPKGSEGSDITANAVRGNGGSVSITTQGLFGIEFRENRTPLNDITVSSDFGLDGVFEQNTPGVDPSRGLAELPTDVVDGTRLIDNRCTPAGATQRSSFVVTGRGGLPPSPTDPLTGEAVIADWVTLDSQEENINGVNPKANPTRTTPKQLVEAQGWVYGSDGRVILVAAAPTAIPMSPWSTSPSCQGKSKVKS